MDAEFCRSTAIDASMSAILAVGRCWLRALTSVALGLVACVSAAQPVQQLADLPLTALLDMEISGASRFPTRRSEAAATVTVVTRAEIRALGHRALADVLRSVRGLMLASDRVYAYAGVRGFFAAGDYNTRVLLLVDGNRVNDSLYDQAFLGNEFPLDVAEIDRVEFVPGQGSAVYGPNALFGVINVITRGAGVRQEHNITLGLGSFGERRASVSLRAPGALGGWSLMYSRATATGDEVPNSIAGGNPPAAGGVDGVRRSALFARWDHGPWRASLLNGSRDKAVPLGQGVVFGNPLNRYRDGMTIASVQFQRPMSESEQGTLRLYAGAYRFTGDYAVDYPPVTHNRDIARGRWWGLDARLTSTRFLGHRIVLGMEWQRTGDLEQQNFDVAPEAVNYLASHTRSQRGALFAEDQIALGEHWSLHLGGRVDVAEGSGTDTSPRAAVLWRPSHDWVFKAVHGRAFRTPNAYEAYYEVDAPAGYRRNEALQSERVVGDEWAVEWQPSAVWRVSAAAYRNRARRLMILGYDAYADRYQFENVGYFTARGLELELEYARDELRARLNASWNTNRSQPETGLLADVFPRRMLKATVVSPVSGAWSSEPLWLGLEAEALDRRGSSAGRAVLNVTLTAPGLPGGVRAVLSVRDAFGRGRTDPGADTIGQPTIPLSGRTWGFELEWPVGR
jgi:iron complex outermembrane receptor protein